MFWEYSKPLGLNICPEKSVDGFLQIPRVGAEGPTLFLNSIPCDNGNHTITFTLTTHVRTKEGARRVYHMYVGCVHCGSYTCEVCASVLWTYVLCVYVVCFKCHVHVY